MDSYIARDRVSTGDDVDAPHIRNGKLHDDADILQIVDERTRDMDYQFPPKLDELVTPTTRPSGTSL